MKEVSTGPKYGTRSTYLIVRELMSIAGQSKVLIGENTSGFSCELQNNRICVFVVSLLYAPEGDVATTKIGWLGCQATSKTF